MYFCETYDIIMESVNNHTNKYMYATEKTGKLFTK